MRAHTFVTGLVALLTTINISNTQEEERHGVENAYKKRSGKLDYNQLPQSMKDPKSGDYRDYSDYEQGQASQPDISSGTFQWDSSPTLQRQGPPQQTTFGNQNKSSVHRRKDQAYDEVNDHLHLTDKWPDASKHLGQLSAVSIDKDGNIVVFHRGDRTWNSRTFLPNNIYNEQELGTITESTIVVFNSTTGKVVREWGSRMFYMPHGLTVDSNNNVWATDVALHQVFKFSADKAPGSEPTLTLGVRLIPGNDDTHFCKPSDVAVMTSGDFFISDGYCNTRVIKYSKSGKKLMQWGRSTFRGYMEGQQPSPYEFSVPHSLALAEDRDLLCVADRENGRIQCFNAHNGTYLMQLHSPKMGSRLFSVAYSHAHGGSLYVVNGPDNKNSMAKGFVIDLSSNKIVEEFAPTAEGFRNPHDISVSPDGSQVYVVELNPYRVWKFTHGKQYQSGHLDVKVNTQTVANVPVSSAIVPSAPAPPPLSLKKNSAQPLRNTNESSKSVTTAVGISIAVIGIFVTVSTVAAIRMRSRGYLFSNGRSCRRWDFSQSSVEGFKLGQFLDRHSGFEKVNTEESDEEEEEEVSSTEVIIQPQPYI